MRIEPIEREKNYAYTVKQTCSECGEDVYLRMRMSEYNAWKMYWKYDRTRNDSASPITEISRIAGFDETKSIFIKKSICPMCQRTQTDKKISNEGFIYGIRCRTGIMEGLDYVYTSKVDKSLKNASAIASSINAGSKPIQPTENEMQVFLYEHDLEDEFGVDNSGTIFVKPFYDREKPDVRRIVSSEFQVINDRAYYQLVGKLKSSAELTISSWFEKGVFPRMHQITANGNMDYPDIPDTETFEQEHPGKIIKAYLITEDLPIEKIWEMHDGFHLCPYARICPEFQIEDWDIAKERREYRIMDSYESGDDIIALVADMSRNEYGSLLAFYIQLMKIFHPDNKDFKLLFGRSASYADMSVSREVTLTSSTITKKSDSKRKIKMPIPKPFVTETNRFIVKNEKTFWDTVGGIYSEKPIRHIVWPGPDGNIYHSIGFEGEFDYADGDDVDATITFCKPSKKIQIFIPVFHQINAEKELSHEVFKGWKMVQSKKKELTGYDRVYLKDETEKYSNLYVANPTFTMHKKTIGFYIRLYLNVRSGKEIKFNWMGEDRLMTVEISDEEISTVTDKLL